jgi:epoxyqueuosine reductase
VSSGHTLAQEVKKAGLALGFDTVGIAPAEPTEHTRRLREWLARGYAGSMDYLAARVDEREDPRRVLEGAQSVIVGGLVYATDDAAPAPFGLARYAAGDDYHEVVLDRMHALAAAVEALAEREVRSRVYVDTGPVSERAMAARAGLGWIGKNSCLIHPRLGSYLFLGVLICDLPLAADTAEPDHCGSCRACLDACPTDAFAEPYVLDARRCIAYTTIEDPGPIPESLREAHGSWVFGCDICQEVCPWNRGPLASASPQGAAGAGSDPLGLRERLAPREGWRRASLAWLLGLDEEAWREATRHSAVRRARWRGLQRNALVAAGNSGDGALVPLVEAHASGGDALLEEHARWALRRLTADVAQS